MRCSPALRRRSTCRRRTSSSTLAAPRYVDSHGEHVRQDLIKTLNTLLTAAANFNDDLAKAQADKTLSPEGKTAAGVRVARAALDTLTAVEATTVKQLAERIALVEKTMISKVTYAAPKDAERVTHEANMREIRDQLRGLPASERLAVYLTSTDPMVLAAIDSAPATLSAPRPDGSRRLEPFVDPAERAAAMMARAEQANPVAARTLSELRSMKEAYSLAVAGVRAEILAEVPEAAAVPAATMHVAP